jgi:hypothetical protein
MMNKTSLRSMAVLVLITALTVLSGCGTMTADGYNAASSDKSKAYGTHDGWRQSSVAH